MAGIEISTAAVTAPVTLDEVKGHRRITHTDEDKLITGMIGAAVGMAQNDTNRQFVCATFSLKLDRWFSKIYLPLGPYVSLSSITYVDSNGDTQTLASTEYTVISSEEPAYICLAYLKTWPTLRAIPDCVTITFVAGYAAKYTANSTTNVFTAAGRTYADDDVVRISKSGLESTVAVPGGLAEDTDYHVINVSGQTLQLAATSGGEAITITTTGTGTQFFGEVPRAAITAIEFLVGHLYVNREPEVQGGAISKYDLATDTLLGTVRLWIPENE